MAEWSNVAWALQQAVRGKRGNANVQTALHSAEWLITQISQALKQGCMPVGSFNAFTIHDPKKRIIHVAPLADRIAHHAIMRFVEPRLDRALLPTVFACRKGKGVHAAISYAQKQMRQNQ